MPAMMPMYIPTVPNQPAGYYPGGTWGGQATPPPADTNTDLEQTITPPSESHPEEIPILGQIRRIELGGTSQEDMAFAARCHVVQIDQSDSQAEVFRGLSSTLLGRFGSAQQSLVVTSSTTQCGKTTCACNLALSLAQAGRRILLVEANLDAPALHRVFSNTKENPGLVDVLTNTNPDLWEQAIQSSLGTGYSIDRCGKSQRNGYRSGQRASRRSVTRYSRLTSTVKESFRLDNIRRRRRGGTVYPNVIADGG
jgi:Mrp family chromosome partitioning ATPase